MRLFEVNYLPFTEQLLTMSAFLGEIVGTAILILLGNGVVANVVLDKTKGNNSGWIVITLGWGIAVFTGVFISAPFSGAHLNPAVTVGLAVAGNFPLGSVVPYILAQMIGAAIGTTLVWLMYRPHYRATEDSGLKRATFCTTPEIRTIPANFLSEMIGTFVLVYGVLHVVGASVGDQSASLGSLDALPVGLVVLVVGLSLGGTTGYAINPARDLAPRIMHAILPIEGKGDSDWSYAWVPVIGPLAGGVVAALMWIYLG